MAYSVAWSVRRAVKPLTSQAFRHKVRHALLRKAYFDDSYATPPLVAAGARGAIVEPEIKYPPHAASQGRNAASTSWAISPRRAASANRRARCCAS